jgi:hypothetical protein
MEVNEKLRKQIFAIIKNQIKLNEPPETGQTLDRLKNAGYTDLESKMLIGQCLAVELFDIMKHQKPFDKNRYASNLAKLPAHPFED